MKLSVSLQLLDLGESVKLLAPVISSSQGLYLYTNTEKCTHNTNTKHPWREWDSNPRSRRPREQRQFMPETVRLTWPALCEILSIKLCHHSHGHPDSNYGFLDNTLEFIRIFVDYLKCLQNVWTPSWCYELRRYHSNYSQRHSLLLRGAGWNSNFPFAVLHKTRL
jgi:hypothetical protein